MQATAGYTEEYMTEHATGNGGGGGEEGVGVDGLQQGSGEHLYT